MISLQKYIQIDKLWQAASCLIIFISFSILYTYTNIFVGHLEAVDVVIEDLFWIYGEQRAVVVQFFKLSDRVLLAVYLASESVLINFFGKLLSILLANIVIFLLLTIIIATITLIERKVLSLVQRRVGPNYIGYKGRLQFIADALKLLMKHIGIFSFTNRIFFAIIPTIVLILCYLFWMNLIWGPNLAICEIEYNLLFMGILSLLFSTGLFLVGWISKNKYAILSSNRVVIVTLNLEIFLNFILLYLLILFESFSFFQISAMQTFGLWGVVLLLPVLPLIIIVFLLETGRIPFDLGEAESELIAGYTTEMGGFFFALFYLGEYFHLFCFSVVYVLCFFGGWTL